MSTVETDRTDNTATLPRGQATHATERDPLLIGDIAIEHVRNGNVRLRSGGDGRLRVVVPAEDRAAVAAAVAPPSSVVLSSTEHARLTEIAAAAQEVRASPGTMPADRSGLVHWEANPTAMKRLIIALGPLPEPT